MPWCELSGPWMINVKAVTTSWDDGDPNDIRLAELLLTRHINGTFYVPITGYNGCETLSKADVRDLSHSCFEIGAHTISHKSLPALSGVQMRREIVEGKEILEHTLGTPVQMFCYPNGRYNSAVVQQVRAAGYLAARTTRMLSIQTAFPTYEMPTTLQAFPHPQLAYLRNLGRARNVIGLGSYLRHLAWVGDWVEIGKFLFDRVEREGGIWHLYGHSWEINELGLWDELRELLDHIANRDGVQYATNSEAVMLTQS